MKTSHPHVNHPLCGEVYIKPQPSCSQNYISRQIGSSRGEFVQALFSSQQKYTAQFSTS